MRTAGHSLPSRFGSHFFSSSGALAALTHHSSQKPGPKTPAHSRCSFAVRSLAPPPQHRVAIHTLPNRLPRSLTPLASLGRPSRESHAFGVLPRAAAGWCGPPDDRGPLHWDGCSCRSTARPWARVRRDRLPHASRRPPGRRRRAPRGRVSCTCSGARDRRSGRRRRSCRP